MQGPGFSVTPLRAIRAVSFSTIGSNPSSIRQSFSVFSFVTSRFVF